MRPMLVGVAVFLILVAVSVVACQISPPWYSQHR